MQSFERMCRKIVHPTPHPDIGENDMIDRKFRRNSVAYQVFTVTNKKNERLSCIVFPQDFTRVPTVLYLHGNGGHKMEALQMVRPQINLVAFDFAACGKSQGRCLTYGQKEAEDIDCVVREVQSRFGVRKLVLWGRSMGASLGLMYASLHPKNVSTLILDTPFRSLEQVVRNVAQHNSSAIPGFVMSIVLYFVEKKVRQLAGSDVFKVDFKMHLNLLNQMPAFFIYSTKDAVVLQQNVRELYEAYRGPKQLRHIESQHQQDRPHTMVEQALAFIRAEQRIRSTRSSMMGTSRKGIGMSIRGSFSSK